MHDLVEENALQQPFLIPIGERAEKIAEAFGDRQIQTQEALAEVTKLAEETQQAQHQYAESGLSVDAFAAFWFLRGRGIEGAEEAGREMGLAFARHPYWRNDPKQEQQVRVALTKAVLKAGVKAGIGDMLDEILNNLRRATA